MTEFILPTDNAIHGIQLADEISQQMGIEIDPFDLVFIKPRTVRLPLQNYGLKDREAEIQTVVDAHIPDLDYFPEDVERRTFESEFIDLINQVETEIAWLDETIPQIGSADLGNLRIMIERLARQNQAQLKAWRFVAR